MIPLSPLRSPSPTETNILPNWWAVEKDNDVAVLKIEAAGLQPVTLGDSDSWW